MTEARTTDAATIMAEDDDDNATPSQNDYDNGEGRMRDANNSSSTISTSVVNNNFENYLRIRMRSMYGDDDVDAPPPPRDDDDATSSSSSSSSATRYGGGGGAGGGGGTRYYNHLTTPLAYPTSSSRERASSSSSPSSPVSSSSAFTDHERSRIADRFFDIFAERIGNAVSSGKLSRAWRQREEGGVGIGGTIGSVFSWPWKEEGSTTTTTSTKNHDDRGIMGGNDEDDHHHRDDREGGGVVRRLLGTIDPPPPRRKNDDDDYYAVERDLMMPHLTPLVWGCGCAFVTLSSLRFGRWYRGGGGGWGGYVVGGYVGGARSRGAGGHVRNGGVDRIAVVDGSVAAGPPSGRRIASAADARPIPQDVRRVDAAERRTAAPRGVHDDGGAAANAIYGLGTLLVDAALSLLFGMSVSIFLTRRDVLMDDFATVPLLDGESVLVEELCEPFGIEMDAVNERVLPRVRGHRATRRTNDGDASDGTDVGGSGRVKRETAAAAEEEEVEEVPYSELWKDENLGEFDSLRAVRDFVVNCREREIRQATTRSKGDSDG